MARALKGFCFELAQAFLGFGVVEQTLTFGGAWRQAGEQVGINELTQLKVGKAIDHGLGHLQSLRVLPLALEAIGFQKQVFAVF